MTHISIQKVVNDFQRRRFATFPWKIYRDDPLWVPPLIPERMKQLNPEKGTFFSHGEADFFLAYRDGARAHQTRRSRRGMVCPGEEQGATPTLW